MVASAERTGSTASGVAHHPVRRGPTIRVLIVDDHAVIRHAVASLIDAEPGVEVVASTGDVRDALELANQVEPDVGLIEFRIGRHSGARLCAELFRRRPEMGVIVFSVLGSQGVVHTSLTSGARGFVLKRSESEVLLEAIHKVAAGETFIDPAVRHRLSRTRRRSELPFGLTPTEMSVVEGLSRGLSNRQIATELGVAEVTVKTHLRKARMKTGVGDRSELARAVLGGEGAAPAE